MSLTASLENLNCPICFDLPKSEVFQCKNGHPICKQCSDSVDYCPQCRVSFEEGKIRNRLVEGLLDQLELSCQYNSYGCTVKLLRRDLDKHAQFCLFRQMNICKITAWKPDCTFATNHHSMMFNHIMDAHGAKLFQNDSLAFTVNTSNSIFESYKAEQLPGCAQLVPWETTAADGNSKRFLIGTFLSRHNGRGPEEMSFLCLFLHSDPQLVSQFLLEVEVRIHDSNVTWKWKGNSTHYKEVNDAQSAVEHAPLQISLKYLKQIKKTMDLKYSVSVSVIATH